MKCPNCGKKTTYSLFQTADDYKDGIVKCNNCGKQIATFNLDVLIDDEESEEETE